MAENSLYQVGEYRREFNIATGQELPCGPIYQSAGLRAHIKKRHPDTEENLALVPVVLAEPDYIGHNPKEPDSVELVKVIEGNVMVCVKLARDKDYFYVASVFEITNGKLNNRLASGRLKKY